MDSITEMFSLKDQIAIVTGASRGIGSAMAISLAEAGASLILIQRDPTDTRTHDTIKAKGGRAVICEQDLTCIDETTIPHLRTICTQTYGSDNDLGILVNCAGIQRRHPAEQFPTDDWDQVMGINLRSIFLLCRGFGEFLMAQPPKADGQRGCIINVASLLSFQGGINVAAYAAAKGGVAQLTKALSNEWAGRGIRVNAIAPGYIDTDMNAALRQDGQRDQEILKRIPAGRWGTPDDFRGPTLFLASSASLYVTGEVLTVDGGWMGR